MREASSCGEGIVTATKVSTCIDCTTTIIGERLRCPACHARHADVLAATPLKDEDRRTRVTAPAPADDDDMTVPRPRVIDGDGASGRLARWIVVLELCCVVTLGLILGVRGCL